jgi:hypothetical protein
MRIIFKITIRTIIIITTIINIIAIITKITKITRISKVTINFLTMPNKQVSKLVLAGILKLVSTGLVCKCNLTFVCF